MFEICIGFIVVAASILSSGLCISSPKTPKPPPPPPNRPEDTEIAAAADKQRKIANARRGRSSTVRTILSEDTSKKKSQLGA